MISSYKYTLLFTLSLPFLFMTGCAREEIEFSTFEKIDTHVHVRYSGPEFFDQAVKDNFKAVVVILDHRDIGMQHDYVEQQKEMHPQQFIYTTAFPIAGWDDPDWQTRTIDHLREAFDGGATAVKIWKNVGMEFKDQNGNFVTIDDPKFDPIIDFIESQDKTLTAHLGEPRDCWLPLEEMLGESNRQYFAGHPEYHMYLHPEYLSYEEQIAAMERMLEKHPNVRYVGCHLASIEWSVTELAKFLDKYPNVAVDMAERIDDLQLRDSDEVRQFFIDYQDRLLYATDFGIEEGDDAAVTMQRLHDTWMMDWNYFTTDSVMTIPDIAQPVKGLDLPPEVLKKIYRENALKWYPALQ
ncbi:MAG: amidohydrolase family protein [Fidelibacterota bacterium]|nr:MAG: amidohydrolase family protein [Candidatus Neomarinimicrobiota bacterium]